LPISAFPQPGSIFNLESGCSCIKFPKFSISIKTRQNTFTRSFSLTLFVFCLSFSFGLFAKTNNCSSHSYDEQAYVTKVYDGDSLKLADGRKIRLIGINTPEMNYDTGTPEPYAEKAKQLLENTVLKHKVRLKYGTDKKDHYKRTLAHLLLNDETNIQYVLLEKGYASNIAIPPNLWMHKCYQAAEKLAQKTKKGIWNNRISRPIKAKSLDRNRTGYKRVIGRINSIDHSNKNVKLYFDNKLTLIIAKNNSKYFKNFNFESFINKTVTVKGWVRLKQNRFIMDLKHPSAIETN